MFFHLHVNFTFVMFVQFSYIVVVGVGELEILIKRISLLPTRLDSATVRK